MNGIQADVPLASPVTATAEPAEFMFQRRFSWRTRVYGTPPEIVARWPTGVACAVLSAIVAADALFVDKPEFTTLDSLIVLAAGLVTAVIVVFRTCSPVNLRITDSNPRQAASPACVWLNFRAVQLDTAHPLQIDRNTRWINLVGHSTNGAPIRLARTSARRPHPYFNDGVDEFCKSLGVTSPISADHMLWLSPVSCLDTDAPRPSGARKVLGVLALLAIYIVPMLTAGLAMDRVYDGDSGAPLPTIAWFWFSFTFLLAALRIFHSDAPNWRYQSRHSARPRRVEIHHLPKRSFVYLRIAGSMYPTMVPGLHARNRRGMTAADQQAFEARVNRFAAASNLGPPVIATPGAAA